MALRRLRLTGAPLVQVAGGLLALVSLLRPWMVIPLGARYGPFKLPVFAGGMEISWISYGAVIVLLLLAAVVIAVRREELASAYVGLIGLAIFILPLFFVFESAISDFALIFNIAQHRNDFSIISRQAGYAIPRSQPDLRVLLPITGAWSDILGTLRDGWVLTLGGGLLMFWAGFGGIRRLVRRQSVVLGLVAAAALVLVVTARGVAADALMKTGGDNVHSGDYVTARFDFDAARALNPEVMYDSTFVGGLARLEAQADPSDPAIALLGRAQILSDEGDTVGGFLAVEQAYQDDPGNAYIAAQYRDALRRRATKEEGAIQLAQAIRAGLPPDPADYWIMGITYERKADSEQSLVDFQQALSLVTDTDIESAIYTQMAQDELQMQNIIAAREYIDTAIRLDIYDYNTPARDIALGRLRSPIA